MRTVLTADRLIDGTGRPPLPHAALVIDDGRVEGIATGDDVGAALEGADRVDVAGGSILPGFVEMHTHMHCSADVDPFTDLATDSHEKGPHRPSVAAQPYPGVARPVHRVVPQDRRERGKPGIAPITSLRHEPRSGAAVRRAHHERKLGFTVRPEHAEGALHRMPPFGTGVRLAHHERRLGFIVRPKLCEFAGTSPPCTSNPPSVRLGRS